MTDIRFLEVEHKFIVGSDFDDQSFFDVVIALQPSKDFDVIVEDTYFICESLPGYIYRHRKDRFIEELTLKALSKDPETRLEVNLDLFKSGSTQLDTVKAFLAPLGITWSSKINKNVRVFEFDDCEIVLYEASHKSQSVRCIEIEAKKFTSIEHAKEILEKYQRTLNLDHSKRSDKSLFHLLLEESFLHRSSS